MTAEWLGLEIGSWAELVAAGGALAAAVVSVLALRTALVANGTANDTKRQAKELADAAHARDTRTQRADIARQLQAWWVMWHPEGMSTRYGVMVTNAGHGATVFRNVRVKTHGNANVTSRRDQISFTSLPPGTYVLESNAAGAEKPWSDPRTANPGTTYEPLIKAQRYTVDEIAFEDPMRMSWCWTPAAGLVPRESPA